MKKINIKGEPYKLIITDMKSFQDSDNRTIIGLCDKEKKRIYVEESLSEEDRKKTVLHEIIHAAFNECAADQIISDEMEEILAENISMVIYKCFFKKGKSGKRKRSK